MADSPLVIAGAWEGERASNVRYTAGQEAWSEWRAEAPAGMLASAAGHAPSTLLVHPDSSLLATGAAEHADVLCAPNLVELAAEHVAGAQLLAPQTEPFTAIALPPAQVFLSWLRTSVAERVAQVFTPIHASRDSLAAAAQAAVAATYVEDEPHPPALSHLEWITARPLTVDEALALGAASPEHVGWHAELDPVSVLESGPGACEALALAGCTGVRLDFDAVPTELAPRGRRARHMFARCGITTWASWTVAQHAHSRAQAEAQIHGIVALHCTGVHVRLPAAAVREPEDGDLGPWAAAPAGARLHPVLKDHEITALRDRLLALLYDAWGPSRLRALDVHAAGAAWAEAQGFRGERALRCQREALRRLRPYARALERFASTPAVAEAAADVRERAARVDDTPQADVVAQERFVLGRMLRETRKRQRGSRGTSPPPMDAWRLMLPADRSDPSATTRVEVLTDRAEAARIARNRAKFIATAPTA